MDLQNYIRVIVVVPNCQKIWRGRSDCIRHALDITKKYTDRNSLMLYQVNPMLHSTAVEIEYCVKYGLQGKHYLWEEFIRAIEEGLWEDEYTGGVGAKFYNRTERACQMLNKQFVEGSL